jgi:coproporphyrinogen III oxidase-like Fe-S oxidoreductase
MAPSENTLPEVLGIGAGGFGELGRRIIIKNRKRIEKQNNKIRITLQEYRNRVKKLVNFLPCLAPLIQQ